MNNKKGSSLISFIVYLMLFSLIALLFCSIITSLILPTRTLLQKQQSLIALHLAIDFFVKDVRATRESASNFELISPQELIWITDKTTKTALGWRFFEKRLERIEGVYHNEWKKKRKSVASMGIKDAFFTIEKHNNQAIGIEITLIPIIKDATPIKGYVAL